MNQNHGANLVVEFRSIVLGRVASPLPGWEIAIAFASFVTAPRLVQYGNSD